MDDDAASEWKGMDEAMEAALRERIRRDEAQFSASKQGSTDSLWGHSKRVAVWTERLGREEGLDPALCRMAGLFHDAGKFAGGRYHEDDRPEEEAAVALLLEMGHAFHAPLPMVEEAASAIQELYRDDPDPSPLAKVLFDADNLEKLGYLGVANYFIKTGLRGSGLSQEGLYKITVELTYAHNASKSFWTSYGRGLARERAEESIAYFRRLLDTLRDDGLFDFRIEEEHFDGLRLLVAAPLTCNCGRRLRRSMWSEKGIKCTEVHLEHGCPDCGSLHHLRFCRPRLI